MMPDGSYRLNPTSLARAIGKNHKALGEFLEGKSPQAQSCQGFSLGEIQSIAVVGGGSHIKPIPLYVAAAFLRYWGKRGNAQASAIVEALTTGHLITLFDDAFGVKRTDWERSSTDKGRKGGVSSRNAIRSSIAAFTRSIEGDRSWESQSQSSTSATKLSQVGRAADETETHRI